MSREHEVIRDTIRAEVGPLQERIEQIGRDAQAAWQDTREQFAIVKTKLDEIDQDVTQIRADTSRQDREIGQLQGAQQVSLQGAQRVQVEAQQASLSLSLTPKQISTLLRALAFLAAAAVLVAGTIAILSGLHPGELLKGLSA